MLSVRHPGCLLMIMKQKGPETKNIDLDRLPRSYTSSHRDQYQVPVDRLKVEFGQSNTWYQVSSVKWSLHPLLIREE